MGKTWTCAAISGHCGNPSGKGAIDELVDVSVGGKVIFSLTGTVADAAPAGLTNDAYVTPPTGTVDPKLSNNHHLVVLRRGVIPTKLKVVITPPTAVVRSGIPIKAKVVTTNIGKATANKVIACVSLPPGITVSKATGGFAADASYCWRTKSLAPGAHVTFYLTLKGDSRLAGRVQLVAQAQASNAARVGDTSKLIVLPGQVRPEGGFTG